jgi:tetratricopeptide (TPR) repeat protein
MRDVIRSRQHLAFVGRQAQLALFEANLGYDSDDERRRWILNIHGPAGVGKTFLIKQWRRIAQSAGVAHAYVTDTVYDAAEAMAAIAAALGQQGSPLERFQARHQVYEQRRGELQGDPAAPQEAATLWTRTAMRLTLRVAREIPVLKVAAAVADDPAVIEGTDRLRRYLMDRLRNHEDVRLLLSPAEVLSPLFVQDLAELGQRRQLALFFDTYERTGSFLDPWLLDLLDGDRYGDLPETLTVTIAGQYPLEANRWAPYYGLLADLPLESFTELEARELLAQHGVTNQRVIEVIMALSGRLPLWVASLAASRPDDPEMVGDPSGSAVERFLRWEDDAQRREVALTLAAARWFNRDLLVSAFNADMAEQLWEWLRTRPFVADHPAGYQYHQVVRAHMLRLLRRESPETWQQRHQKLADFHRSCCDALGLDHEAGWANPVWQEHALEETYHRLCATPHAYMSDALDQVLYAYEEQTALARRWIEAIQQAGDDSEAPGVQQWGQRLQATMTGSDDDWLGFLTLLARDGGLPVDRQAAALRLRGILHRQADRYEQAIADFDRALELRPDHNASLGDRGEAYRLMGRHDQALSDFSGAIELDPEDTWAIASRGQAYQAMGRYEEALADFNRAIELDPELDWPIISRGQAYQAMDRYEEALADFNRAIELDPEQAWPIISRGQAYQAMDRYEEALADFNRAIELDPEDAWAIASRGEAYRLMGRHDQALSDFSRAIELDPEDAWAIASRGQAYQAMGRYEEALADFNRAIELHPEDAWPIISRGQAYQAMGRYEEALADFNRVLEIDPGHDEAVRNCGQLLRRLGRHEHELAMLTERSAFSTWALARRAELHLLKEQYEAADADIERAIALQPKTDWFPYVRALVQVGQGHDDTARDLIIRAMNINETNRGPWVTVDYAPLFFNQAVYLAALGDHEGVRQEIDTLRTLRPDPEYPDLIPTDRVIEIMELHRTLAGKPMVDKALIVLDQLQALSPPTEARASE